MYSQPHLIFKIRFSSSRCRTYNILSKHLLNDTANPSWIVTLFLKFKCHDLEIGKGSYSEIFRGHTSTS